MVNTLKGLSANSGNTDNFDPSAEEKMLEVERILKQICDALRDLVPFVQFKKAPMEEC